MEKQRFTQRQSQKQKLKTLTRGVMIVAASSMVGIFVYLTAVINTASVEQTKAEMHARLMMGYNLSEGDIIAAYSWNDVQSPSKANIGPDGVSINPGSDVSEGGVDQSYGLSAGGDKKGINLVIPATDEFNTEGIDISFDFKRLEETCDFYSRGSYFNFGMKKGKISIAYKVSIGDNKGLLVDEITAYEIPTDDVFRNYNFTYNPQTGKAEVLVNGVVVWSHEGPEEAPLFWKSSDNVVIAHGMTGNGSKKVLLDNLVIKSTAHINKMPVHLLNFEAISQVNQVMIRWFTAKEMDTDSFRVERSLNGVYFEPIGTVKAAGNSSTLQAYALVDIHPLENIAAYYRLVPTNKPLKSIMVPVIGYKYRKDHIENTPANNIEAAVKEELKKQ
jgi:hypothetical protein